MKDERLKVKGILFFLYFFIFQFSFSSCEGTTFKSSVPLYPVRVVIDTRAVFVDFTPENTNAYITVNEEGYKENGQFKLALSVSDAYGYGGVVAYVSMNGYTAYDLACPYCAARGQRHPCQMNGIYAECPHCGERYELSSGYALPQKGISKEALHRLNINHSDGRLTVTQQQ